MLCDRLICGINNDCMQHRLLAESKLSFEKTCELAQAMETADHDARELQGPPTTAVLKLNRGTGRSFSTGPRPKFHNNLQNNCYQCGGKHSQMIADFVYQSADFARKFVTLKEHAVLRTREQKEMLAVKLTTCHFPVTIQPITMGQKHQINAQCIISEQPYTNNGRTETERGSHLNETRH